MMFLTYWEEEEDECQGNGSQAKVPVPPQALWTHHSIRKKSSKHTANGPPSLEAKVHHHSMSNTCRWKMITLAIAKWFNSETICTLLRTQYNTIHVLYNVIMFMHTYSYMYMYMQHVQFIHSN